VRQPILRRLNWQLHFGEPPKWSADVKFILVDVEASQRDVQKAEVYLRGDARAVAQQLVEALGNLDGQRTLEWRQQLASKVRIISTARKKDNCCCEVICALHVLSLCQSRLAIAQAPHMLGVKCPCTVAGTALMANGIAGNIIRK